MPPNTVTKTHTFEGESWGGEKEKFNCPTGFTYRTVEFNARRSTRLDRQRRRYVILN